jgi:hypothetical protein
MQGRKRYGRPQAMLWANNPGTTVTDPETNEVYHVPLGSEVGASDYDFNNDNEFVILSDHNRGEIDFSPTRIETKERTVNGRMRSHHIADKLSVSTSWDMLPSRSYHLYPEFDSNGVSDYNRVNNEEFTVDGGAGGTEILDWYEKYTGSFWLYLSYDKHQNFRNLQDSDEEYGKLNRYSQVIEVFFENFSYSVQKRGRNNFDFWNISVSLEEV